MVEVSIACMGEEARVRKANKASKFAAGKNEKVMSSNESAWAHLKRSCR
jgi:hypothetical protein